jgi:hypothetical protein
MKIIEVTENKKEYLDLLLLADEQENMVDCYLDNGRMYILDDNGVKSECVKPHPPPDCDFLPVLKFAKISVVGQTKKGPDQGRPRYPSPA